MPNVDDLDQVLDQDQQPEEPQPPAPDPNNVYAGDLKRYLRQYFVILDATEENDVFFHEQDESVHKRNCHMMEITMRRRSSLEIRKIRLPPGATEADFQQAIDSFLGQLTKNDLVVWYYHGSAGGTERTWKM